MTELAEALGPNGTIICNYGYPTAPPTCNGMMIERGGDGSGDIQKMQQYAGHIIEYHAQYADRTVATFNASLAAFLVGAAAGAAALRFGPIPKGYRPQ